MQGTTFMRGNLGADPEVRFTADGKPVVGFRLAVTEHSARSGISSQQTVWHRCVVSGELAELARQLKKGDRVGIEGEARSREWTRYGRTQSVQEFHVIRIEAKAAPSEHSQTWESSETRVRSPLEAARAAGMFTDEAAGKE